MVWQKGAWFKVHSNHDAIIKFGIGTGSVALNSDSTITIQNSQYHEKDEPHLPYFTRLGVPRPTRRTTTDTFNHEFSASHFTTSISGPHALLVQVTVLYYTLAVAIHQHYFLRQCTNYSLQLPIHTCLWPPTGTTASYCGSSCHTPQAYAVWRHKTSSTSLPTHPSTLGELVFGPNKTFACRKYKTSTSSWTITTWLVRLLRSNTSR